MSTAAMSLNDIAQRIKNMRFKRKLFGGVDEEDVWDQIKQLDEDYRNLFLLQQKLYQMELKKLKSQNTPQAAPRPARTKTKRTHRRQTHGAKAIQEQNSQRQQ